MNKIIKNKKAFYLTLDNRLFETKEEASSWEASAGYLDRLSLLIAPVDPMKVCLPYVQEDYEVYIMRPRTPNDIVLINSWCTLVSNNNCWCYATTKFVGKDVIICFGYDREWCELYSLEELRRTALTESLNVANNFEAALKEGEYQSKEYPTINGSKDYATINCAKASI